MTRSTQIMMLSAPNYLLHRYLLWLYGTPRNKGVSVTMSMPGVSGYAFSRGAPDNCHETGQCTVIKRNMVLNGEGASHQGRMMVGGGSWNSLSRRRTVRTCGHQRLPGNGVAGQRMDSGARPSGYKACLWFACCLTLEGGLYNPRVPRFLYKMKQAAVL